MNETTSKMLFFLCWFLRNIFFIVTGNFKEIGNMFNRMEAIEEHQKRRDFIKLFEHLKPVSSEAIIDCILDEVIEDIFSEKIQEFQQIESCGWEKEVENLESSFFSLINDSGFIDEDDSVICICQKNTIFYDITYPPYL